MGFLDVSKTGMVEGYLSSRQQRQGSVASGLVFPTFTCLQNPFHILGQTQGEVSFGFVLRLEWIYLYVIVYDLLPRYRIVVFPGSMRCELFVRYVHC